MIEKLLKLLQREPRFQLRGGHELRVYLEPPDGDKRFEPVRAALHDISHGGARLLVPMLWDAQQDIVIRIEAATLKDPLLITAQVCWCRSAREGQWWLGCQFRPRIPSTMLALCAKSGALERREQPREFASIEVTATWESGVEDESVRIVNISQGGVCIVSREGGRMGGEVFLEIGKAASRQLITAEVVWQHRTRAGYATGCQFTSRKAYQILKQAQDGPSALQLWQRMLHRH